MLARFIEHALLQVLQEGGEATCSERSYGFRPPRRAHQAVEQAPADLRAGYTWVVALALEKVFDRGSHDVLLSRGRRRVQARRGVRLIHRSLKAGVVPLEGSVAPTAEGTPPGGARSPLLANRLLDELDQELETRGHRLVRYAGEANLEGRSRPAGARVMARVTRFLKRKLRLTGNAAKSAVDRPWNRTSLGFTFTKRQAHRRKVSEKALQACKAKVRALTGRARGRTRPQIVQELRQLLLGWRACFGCAEARAPRRDLDQWRRRRRRSYHGKPWGRRGDRELRERGVGRQLAGTTVKSAHGPWRLRQSPALASALPQRDVAALGLPSLFEGGLSHDLHRTAGDVTRMSGGVGGRETARFPPIPIRSTSQR